jgi:hypothetical protein
MNKMVDLSQQQIQQAAQAGVTLLNTAGAVNVPGPMSISGITQVLHAVLLGIAEKRFAVIDLTKKPAEPNKEVEAAVAAAVKNNGQGEAEPIAPVESEETPPAGNETEAAGEQEG